MRTTAIGNSHPCFCLMAESISLVYERSRLSTVTIARGVCPEHNSAGPDPIDDGA